MSKNQDVIPPPSSARLPAVPPPRPTLPALPSSSGTSTFWYSPTEVVRRDTEFIGTHADKLRAMADQAGAFQLLIEKRDDLGMALARIHSLNERAAHAYQLGRIGRASELRCAQLESELDEVNAKIALAQAQHHLAQYQPQPPEAPAPAPPPAPSGLTPADIRQAAERLPDISPESIETLVMLATAMLAEKRK